MNEKQFTVFTVVFKCHPGIVLVLSQQNDIMNSLIEVNVHTILYIHMWHMRRIKKKHITRNKHRAYWISFRAEQWLISWNQYNTRYNSVQISNNNGAKSLFTLFKWKDNIRAQRERALAINSSQYFSLHLTFCQVAIACGIVSVIAVHTLPFIRAANAINFIETTAFYDFIRFMWTHSGFGCRWIHMACTHCTAWIVFSSIDSGLIL